MYNWQIEFLNSFHWFLWSWHNHNWNYFHTLHHLWCLVLHKSLWPCGQTHHSFKFMMADTFSTITRRRSRPSSCTAVMLFLWVSVCWRRAEHQALASLCPDGKSVACGANFSFAYFCNSPTDSTNFSDNPFVLEINNVSLLSVCWSTTITPVLGWWVGEKKNCWDLSQLFFKTWAKMVEASWDMSWKHYNDFYRCMRHVP